MSIKSRKKLCVLCVFRVKLSLFLTSENYFHAERAENAEKGAIIYHSFLLLIHIIYFFS